MIVGELAALDRGEDADGADQMLVHRIVMIHVELHHARRFVPKSGMKRPSTPASFIMRRMTSGSLGRRSEVRGRSHWLPGRRNRLVA